MDPRDSSKYSDERLPLMGSRMNSPLMEALSLLLIPQGHFCLTGAFTIGLALWPSPIVTVEQKLESRQ